ncbi:insulinase family protein [Candidatus Kaiserbacteria bacterium]|nr:insulinase family protein [Candidatus Kaiserbacteria bacterium]
MSLLERVRKTGGVTEYKLRNGLRVLYKRDTTAPVVAVCITFHVGSRNEAPGHTGSTHILEHLLFKDSEHFNKANGKSFFSYLERFGAQLNATTWVDRTNYFEVLPKEHAEEAFVVEADRLRGSLFNDADLASEMTVVRNEYERSRNNPYELLDEELMQTAFTTHPYRIPTIGTKEDIENSTAAKLREFYDTYYWPNNATLAVFGDMDADEMERLVVKYFAKIPRSPHEIPPFTTTEPTQTKPRACEVQHAAGVSIASLAYKIPEARHADYPALYALATILAGGFSSRLQEKLVDKGLAADAGVATPAWHDPCVMTFAATAAPGVAPQKLIALMRRETRKAAREGVTAAELSRAKARIASAASLERDGVFNEARMISEGVAAGDWTLAYRFEDDIATLTTRAVNAAAKKYLVSAGETQGILIDTL